MAIFKQLVKKQHSVTYKDEKSHRNLFLAAGFSFHKPKVKGALKEATPPQGFGSPGSR